MHAQLLAYFCIRPALPLQDFRCSTFLQIKQTFLLDLLGPSLIVVRNVHYFRSELRTNLYWILHLDFDRARDLFSARCVRGAPNGEEDP